MRSACFALILALAIGGCATAPAPMPINGPIVATEAAADATSDDLNFDGDVVALSFSGGGARAAAFSLGALEGLRSLRGTDGAPLSSHVRLVTAVSGGSILAAYFSQHGEAGIDTFRAAYLDKDWNAQLNTNVLSPLNWVRAQNGGLNGKTVLADWLDREVFEGGRMRDVWRGRGMQTWINATDLYNGTTFAFTPTYFDALCSDLGSVRIADAVAASMAVPIAFSPILAAPFAEQKCPPLPAWVAKARADRAAPLVVRKTAEAFETYRKPEQQKYLHLVDGGVIDNQGLTSLTLARETASSAIAPLSPRDAVRLRRFTFIVVDAEQIRSSEWQNSAKGPTGGQIAGAIANIVIEGPNRITYDSFRRVLSDWEHDVRAWRCALPASEVAALRGSRVDWRCDDVTFTLDVIGFADLPEDQRAKLGATATRVSLPRETIDALIAAGRDTMAKNPSALALTH